MVQEDELNDVQMDLTGDSDEIVPKTAEELAELKKENGNQLYKTKQYKSALPLYTAAIEICPTTASYYANRAACYMMLHNYAAALEDAKSAIAIDAAFSKGYLRMLKCAIALGDLITADIALDKFLTLEPKSGNQVANERASLQILKQFEAEWAKAQAAKDFRKIVYCMDRCLEQAPTCDRYKVIKAENLSYLGRYADAQEIVTGLLQINKGNVDAIFIRGLCLNYEDQADSALNHFSQVLRLAPDHKKALEAYKNCKLLKKTKEEGNQAYKEGKFQVAIDLYTKALAIDPQNRKTNAKLYFNRALVKARLTKTHEAISDCTNALKLDPSYMKPLIKRASCYMEVEDYDNAVADYEQLCKLDKSRENKRLLQDAKLAQKRAQRKDYYKILGVSKEAGEEEIKKAYRKRAMIHHPDRHVNAAEAERAEQERKFKELGEAYGVLSDAKKKARYDSGQDLEEDCGFSNVDPNVVFQSFFGGPSGGTPFSFGNGCPGGFSFQFS